MSRSPHRNIPLVLDLRITHERFGSSSDPSINGHVHYPNDLDGPLNETVEDKIRQYHPDYNNRPSNTTSFMPSMASTCVYIEEKNQCPREGMFSGSFVKARGRDEG
jgi:hypothetical protein